VAYGQGKLLVTNGLGKEAYIVNPGANGIFDGVPPAGDDTVTHFDTSSMGQMNPEGIDFNPDTGTLYIISNEERSDVVETTTTGTVVRVIAIPSVNALHPAAVAYAPGSMNPAVKHLYIADRGVDNGDDPNENDGKVYEITLDDSPPPDNLLANPGFESDPDKDGKPNRWVPYDSSFIRSNAVVHGGSHAGKQFATDNGDYNIGQIVNYLTAGTTYNFSGWVNIPATSDSFTFKLQVRWRDVNNNNIHTDTVKTYTGPTGGWNLATASLVAPAGTTNAKVQMVATSLNATIYVDDFVFKP
jgi:Carbohydrate binding domain